MKKVLPIILLIIVIMVTFGSLIAVNAETPGSVDTSRYKPDDTQMASDKTVMDFGKTVISAIRTVGIIIAVVVIMILGIKYMMGSVEQRAEYKKSMVPYLVGAFMLFAITSIVSLIAQVVADFE